MIGGTEGKVIRIVFNAYEHIYNKFHNFTSLRDVWNGCQIAANYLTPVLKGRFPVLLCDPVELFAVFCNDFFHNIYI